MWNGVCKGVGMSNTTGLGQGGAGSRGTQAGGGEYVIFYDARCGLCQWSRRMVERTRSGVAMRWVDVNDRAELAKWPAVDAEVAQHEVVVLDREGHLHGGYEAVVSLLTGVVPAARKLQRVLLARPMRTVGGKAYHWVSENRDAPHAQQNRRMADPRRCQLLILPLAELRLSRRLRALQPIEQAHASPPAPHPIHHAHRPRRLLNLVSHETPKYQCVTPLLCFAAAQRAAFISSPANRVFRQAPTCFCCTLPLLAKTKICADSWRFVDSSSENGQRTSNPIGK